MDSNENTGKISGRGGATLIAAQNGEKIFLIAGFAGDSVYTRFCTNTTLNCYFQKKEKLIIYLCIVPIAYFRICNFRQSNYFKLVLQNLV